MNVLVNTSYLDPSSEFFFYLISFSLSMWFGFTNVVFLEVPSNSLMHLLFRNFALIFYFFPFDRNCGKAKVSLIAFGIDLLSDSIQ